MGDLLRRSLLHVALLTVVVAVSTLAGAGPVALAADDPATVTAAVQVTSNPAPIRAHSSPQIVRNPTNGELVIVEADIRGDEACTVHISVDDGRTWLRGGDPMKKPATDCTLHADYGPYVAAAFTRSGVLYLAFVASVPDKRAKELVARSVFLARSEDSGRSFTTTTVFEAPPEDDYLRVNKGPMLAVDPENGSRLYVGWRQGSFAGGRKFQSIVSASGDGGRTFRQGIDLTDDRGGDYPALAVDSDGTLHAVYWTRTAPGPTPAEPPVRPIYYLASTDQGRTFSDRVAMDPGNQNAAQPPLLVADPKSKSLYMTWHSHAEQKNSAPGFKGDLDIYFLASHDSGRSWGQKLVLNDDKSSGANQYLPGIAVAPDGRVDVGWYDYRSSQLGPDNGLQDVYYASSGDQGRSFGPNLRITDRSIDRSIGVWDNNIGSHHNMGVASTSNAVYYAWQDSRNRDALAQPEDVYMAKLNLDGPVPLSESGGYSKAVWALAGAGVTAALMGLALFAASALSRSRQPSAAASRTPA